MDLNLLMQGSPAKALELFTKLADPSDASAKARGKLFTELKAEIDLHLKTEEEYLLPILLKNPDTKALAQEGMNNNRELRTKLTAIDAMSKTDSSFIGKLKDLQQAFRHHARDEKNDLLPAVKRALTDFHQSSVVASAAPMMASSQGHHAEPLSETPTAIPLAKANPAKATEMSKPADSTAKADHAQVQQRPVQPQFNEGRMTAAKSPSPSLAELFFWPWAGTMQALSGSKAFPVVRGPSNLEEVLPLGEEVIEVGKRTVQQGCSTLRIPYHVDQFIDACECRPVAVLA
jgi:hypothetical protein